VLTVEKTLTIACCECPEVMYVDEAQAIECSPPGPAQVVFDAGWRHDPRGRGWLCPSCLTGHVELRVHATFVA
jgi:hypothetical protein